VTHRALRFYEAAKLIEPRRKGKLRLYREIDIERLKAILKLKKCGFTLAEIRLLNKAGATVSGSLGLSREGCSKQIEYLEQRIQEFEAAILDLQQLISVLP
jgi:DNA-binding transcriptional MerR regulator